MIDLTKLINKLNMDVLVADIMGKLKISSLDMYFIVSYEKFELDIATSSLGGEQIPSDFEEYRVEGITYSEEAAKEVRRTATNEGRTCKILKLRMGKLLSMLEQLGGTEEIH